jgi:hypothetical protein
MRHPTTWPAPVHPLVEAGTLPPGLDPVPLSALVADPTRTVEAFQYRPDLTLDLVTWSGGVVGIVDGAPALLLRTGGVVRLGDYALRDNPDGDVRAEVAAGFWQRWSPADPGD